MSIVREIEGPGGRARRHQRGQAATEFAISAVVLLLIVSGLLDLGRVFYFQVDLYGAAREGARAGSWFDTPTRRNPALDDADILSAVSDALQGAGLSRVTTNSSGSQCPAPSDSNTFGNPPFGGGLYPSAVNSPNVYLCYTPPSPAWSGCTIGTAKIGSVTAAPTGNCWRLGDLNVIVLMRYGLLTPMLQNLVGNGTLVAANSHMTVQGKP